MGLQTCMRRAYAEVPAACYDRNGLLDAGLACRSSRPASARCAGALGALWRRGNKSGSDACACALQHVPAVRAAARCMGSGQMFGAKPTRIRLGQTLSGSVKAGESAWFTFTASAGQAYEAYTLLGRGSAALADSVLSWAPASSKAERGSVCSESFT